MKRNLVSFLSFLFALWSLLSSGIAQAAIIYTSYPHNWDGGGWIIPENYFAVRFDVTSNYYLNQISLPIFYGGTDPNPLYLQVELWSSQYADGALPRPASLIGNWQSQPIYGMTGTAPSEIATSAVSQPLLLANNSYWLLFKGAWTRTGDSDNRALLWYESQPYESLGDISDRMFYYSTKEIYNPWDGDFMAFQVQGSPVPIPCAVWLLGSGIVGLIGVRSIKS